MSWQMKRRLTNLILMTILSSACIEPEEDILAYQYDPERLCLVTPVLAVKVATREVTEPPKGPVPLLLVPTCSVDKARLLVSFQSYFDPPFEECGQDWDELIYWKEIPGKTSVDDLKCAD